MIEFRYNSEEDIIYLERSGDISLQDVLSCINSINQNFQSLQKLHIIDDLRHSVSTFKKEEYPVMINELKKRVNRYNQVKHAVIVNNPSDTALTILFAMKSKSIENYSFKIFSTIEAAKYWLK